MKFSFKGCLASFFLLVILSACSKSNVTESNTSVAAPVYSEENKSVTKVDPSANVTLNAPSNVGGASVNILPGTLAVAAELVLEAGAPLASSSILSELPLPTDVSVSTVGTSLIVRPTADVALNGTLAISLAIPTGSGLLDTDSESRLVVFYKYYDPTAKGLVVGLKSVTDSDVTISTNADTQARTVTIKGYFGSYWAAILSRALTSDETPAAHASEIAITNADGAPVITSAGVVDEKIVKSLKSNAFAVAFAQGGVLTSDEGYPSMKIQISPNNTGVIWMPNPQNFTWKWNGATLTASLETPIEEETETDSDPALPGTYTTYGFRAQLADGQVSFYSENSLDFPDDEESSYGQGYDEEPTLYTATSFSQFHSLHVAAGDVYSINMGDFRTGVFQFNANGTATDLSGIYTDLEWNQDAGQFTLHNEDFSVVLHRDSSDTSLTPTFTSLMTTEDGDVFATGLGVQVKDAYESLPVTFSGFTKTYASKLNHGMHFSFNEDRSFVIDVEGDEDPTFLWSVGGGKVLATAYYDEEGTPLTSVEDMLACEDESLTCYAENRTYEVLRKDADTGELVILRHFYDEESQIWNAFIDSYLPVAAE